MSKLYDFAKAKKIIEENKNDLVEVLLGMHEDWFWTAETVWENGNYTTELPDAVGGVTIAGIDGSCWATPTLCLRFKSEPERMIPCYSGESSGFQRMPVNGCLSGPCQASITPLEKEASNG